METSAPAAVAAFYPLIVPDIAAGQELYAQYCADCHGATGRGDGTSASSLPNPVRPIGDPAVGRAAVPVDWFAIVSQGNLDQSMPGFAGNLSDRDTWDVVAYFLSLSSTRAELETGAGVYQQFCAACHGTTGEGNGPKALALAGLMSDWTDPSQTAQLSLESLYTVTTSGAGTEMPAYQELLSETERWAVAAYIRGFNLGTSGLLTPAVPAVSEAVEAPLPGKFAISGKVENASGGMLPADLVVTLQLFDGMQAGETLQAGLEQDGSYRFNNLDLVAGRVYLASVDYLAQSFFSDALMADDVRQGDEARLPIRVYDLTSDTSVLVADRLHIFLDSTAEDAVRVVELYLVSNPSSQVVIPAADGSTSLEFTVPAGAQNLEFQDGALGERFLPTANGFTDTQPVLPGQQTSQVLFAYDLPIGRKTRLEIIQPLEVRSIIVAAPSKGISLKSPQLTFAGQRDMQGSSVDVYNGTAMSAGSTLQIELKGPALSVAPRLQGNTLASTLLGLGVFILAIGIAGFILTRQRRTEAPEESTAAVEAVETEDVLLDDIVALDDMYQAGNLGADAYRQRRAELKERLRALREK